MTSDEATILARLESFLQQQIELSRTQQFEAFCQQQAVMFARLKVQLLQGAKLFFAEYTSPSSQPVPPPNDAHIASAELPTESASNGPSKLTVEPGVSSAANSSEHHQPLSTHSRKDNNVDTLPNCQTNGSSSAVESAVLKFFSNSLESHETTPQCDSLSTEHNQEAMLVVVDDLMNSAQVDTSINGESQQINDSDNSNEQDDDDKCTDGCSISSGGHVSLASKLQILINSKLLQNFPRPLVSQPSTIPISQSEDSQLRIPEDNGVSRWVQPSTAKSVERSEKQPLKVVTNENGSIRCEPSTSSCNDKSSSTCETVTKPAKPKREPIKAPSPERPYNKYRNNENANSFTRHPFVFNRNDIERSSSLVPSCSRSSKIVHKISPAGAIVARDNLKKHRQPKGECLKRKQTNDVRLSSSSSSENDHVVDVGELKVQIGSTRTVSRSEAHSDPKKRRISVDQRRGSAHSNNSDFTPYLPNKRADNFDWVCPECELIFQTKNEYDQHARATGHGPLPWPEKDLRGRIQQKRFNDACNDLRSKLQKRIRHESLDQLHGSARWNIDTEMTSHPGSSYVCSIAPCQSLEQFGDLALWKQHTALHFEHVEARQRIADLALPTITIRAQPVGKPTKYLCSFGSCTFCTLDPRELTQHEFICLHKV